MQEKRRHSEQRHEKEKEKASSVRPCYTIIRGTRPTALVSACERGSSFSSDQKKLPVIHRKRSHDAHRHVRWVAAVCDTLSAVRRQRIIMHVKEACVEWSTSEKKLWGKYDTKGGGQTCASRACSR